MKIDLSNVKEGDILFHCVDELVAYFKYLEGNPCEIEEHMDIGLNRW